jgi:hypothetical protein
MGHGSIRVCASNVLRSRTCLRPWVAAASVYVVVSSCSKHVLYSRTCFVPMGRGTIRARGSFEHGLHGYLVASNVLRSRTCLRPWVAAASVYVVGSFLSSIVGPARQYPCLALQEQWFEEQEASSRSSGPQEHMHKEGSALIVGAVRILILIKRTTRKKKQIRSRRNQVKAHARNDNLHDAERWLQLAREKHGKLDVFGYNALIAGFHVGCRSLQGRRRRLTAFPGQAAGWQDWAG